MSTYHQPVMVSECIDLLALKPGGIYVDATLGGGGHSWAMLQACPNIKLYCIDQDDDALAMASTVLNDKINSIGLIKANFARLRTELALRQVKGIDGVLYDLGVSSHQIDAAERGFSYDRDASLDMRMDLSIKQTAADLVNNLSVRELTRVIKDYSEELHAGRIARAIEQARAAKPITRTTELSRIIETVVGTGSKESQKSKARVFQALRIYVNRELEVLPFSLRDAINLLNKGGRIVVMSYHSLEDRIVKNIFRDAATGCKCPPNLLQCVCNEVPRLKLLNSRPLTASEQEIKLNSRAKSAKLRAAVKI
ncbi:MAG TPA: 16S rRNA (cytosine(1402)-N(4))-methyltransferase RsmH [Candidatus Cloacimonadota bacterium]|nr:16S rRNA (cytosine(1402)-N(4))-methyltransferase RsmH [Candidatus Cloacimonadota bacterium]